MSEIRHLSDPETLLPGIERMRLNIGSLYPDPILRQSFESRLIEFFKVGTIPKIMCYNGGVLTYDTGAVIPHKQDSRPPLMLLFGNPAPD
jgi:hypothetical protein